MSTAPQSLITPEQYLEIEREADHKSEYFAGEMFAMAGATRAHNLVTLNTASEIRSRLKGRDCEVYSNDMRVKVEATGLYTYPDIVVACGERQFEDDVVDTLLNPVVIIEVLSDSTEAYDRGRKFAHYRKIDSLSEYVLIAQDRCHVERYERQPDHHWLLSEVDNREASIELPSIECRLAVADVYDRVTFDDRDLSK